jgi:predicted RNase H-like HicB family nuclease
MHQYDVLIYWDDTDQFFVAEVPELLGCAADGTTREEALRNAEEAMERWIRIAKEKGWTIPEPKRRVAKAG